MKVRKATALEEVMKLSIPERILAVEAIWDSIALHPERVPVTEDQKAELDRRLESLEKNPKEGRSWPDVKSNILAKSRK